jgi:hypothetical protein
VGERADGADPSPAVENLLRPLLGLPHLSVYPFRSPLGGMAG